MRSSEQTAVRAKLLRMRRRVMWVRLGLILAVTTLVFGLSLAGDWNHSSAAPRNDSLAMSDTRGAASGVFPFAGGSRLLPAPSLKGFTQQVQVSEGDTGLVLFPADDSKADAASPEGAAILFMKACLEWAGDMRPETWLALRTAVVPEERGPEPGPDGPWDSPVLFMAQGGAPLAGLAGCRLLAYSVMDRSPASEDDLEIVLLVKFVLETLSPEGNRSLLVLGDTLAVRYVPAEGVWLVSRSELAAGQ
ncbi:MAG: hypothetical protein C4551_04260 [Bacillota bacterium]|nr:MAG: hypothetical protein C4551_04260 [Bacillota bacterium]